MAEKKASLIIELKDAASEALAKFKGNIDSLRSRIVEVAGAFAGLSTFVLKSVTEFGQEQEAVARLTHALVTVQGDSKSTVSSLIALADSLRRTTKFSDESVLSMQALLANIGFNGAAIQQLTPRIANLAVAMKMDLGDAALKVAKAIQSGSIDALKRSGIAIDEAAVKNRDFAGILKSLDTNFKEAAKTAGETVPGSLAIFKQAIANVYKELGGGFSAVLVPLVQRLTQLANSFESVSPGIKAAIVVVVLAAAGFTGLLTALVVLSSALATLATGFAILTSPITLTILGITALGVAIFVTKDSIVRSFSEMMGAVSTFSAAINKLLQGDFKGAMEAATEGVNKFSAALVAPFSDLLDKTGQAIVSIKDQWTAFKESFAAEATPEAPAAPGKVKLPGLTGLPDAEEFQQKLLEIRGFQLQVQQITDEHQANLLRSAGRHADAEKLLEARRGATLKDIRANVWNIIATIGAAKSKELFYAAKAAALAEAVIYAWLGYTAALAAPPFPPLSIPQAKLALGLGLTGAALIAAQSFMMAEGGMVLPTAGGVSATIGEGGRAEAVIPLDDPSTKEKLKDTIGGDTVIIQIGTLVADQMGFEEFVRRVDQELFRLQRNRQAVSG